MEHILYVVIPCYNEEEVIEETTKQLTKKMQDMVEKKSISKESRILYVNDGSKDNTWELIERFYEENPFVTGISLSRNKGHQNALLAGLLYAKEKADVTISMDADLQDDISVMDQFLAEFENGNEIVYGVRSSRKKDGFLKKSSAAIFYKFMRLMGVEMVSNHAEYRLMSTKALDSLEQFKEVNLFLRGIVPMIGFSSSKVYYEREKRYAGKTKYSIGKMIAFAIDGITSCSVKPVRIITVCGFLVFLASIIGLIYVVIGALGGNTVAGWATLTVLMLFLGGFQIMSIGIVGEYVGKIYLETKQRPRYIIETVRTK